MKQQNTPFSLIIWAVLSVGWVINLLKLIATPTSNMAAVGFRFIGLLFFHFGGIIGYL